MAPKDVPVEADPAAAEAARASPKDLQLSQSKGQAVTVYDAEAALRRQEEEERAKAEVDIIKAAVGTVFSTRKPRDAVAGTASGLKTMAKGVGIGLASLVVQPYVGAKSQGAKGFVKGMGTGVATCVGTTVAGTVVGSGQIMRGVVNTPGAIFRRALGEVWNSETRSWEKDWYSLPEEAAEVLGDCHAGSSSLAGDSEAASSSGATAARGRRVTDTQLYDLLGVSPQAGEAEIRRAFYKKSLALHPDKNPDDPAATEQFQAVSDAYRILGDEERRRAYDEHGKDSAASALPKIEPVVFFAALFGTHHFEPYVGRLRLAQDIDGDLQSVIRDIVAIDDPEGPQLDALKVTRAHKRMKDLERERQVKCALELAKRLDPVVGIPSEQLEEATAKWQANLESEVKTLAEAPLGVEMLGLIGWLYVNGAEQFNSGKITRMMAKAEAQVHMTKTKGSLAATAGRTCLTVNGIMKGVEKKKKLSETAAKADEAPSSPTSPTSAAKDGNSEASEEHEKAESSAQSNDKAKSSSAPPESHARSGDTAGRGSSSTSPQPASAASELFPGTVVVLCNLRSCPELNEEVGVVERFDQEAGRYVVQLLSEEFGSRKLKAENLRVLEDPSETGSQWSTGGASSSSAPPGGKEGKSADAGKGPDGFSAGNEEAEIAEAFKDTMPLFHDTLWGVTALDIEFTLARVVRRVLRDMSVDKSIRRQRAQALIRLGKILQEPMKARRKELQESKGKPPAAPSSAEGGKQALTSDAASNVSDKTTSSRSSSMLARLKPRVPWSTKKKKQNDGEEQQQKAKLAETKQRQMEAALALMAAGASTEDVDEMLAARSAMDFDFDPSSRT